MRESIINRIFDKYNAVVRGRYLDGLSRPKRIYIGVEDYYELGLMRDCDNVMAERFHGLDIQIVRRRRYLRIV